MFFIDHLFLTPEARSLMPLKKFPEGTFASDPSPIGEKLAFPFSV